MAKAPTLPTITGQFASSGQLNQAFRDIEDSFENTISRDGSTPNTMQADLDLNGNSLLNVDTIDVDNLSIAGLTVTDLASVPEWRSTWSGGVAYVENDLVKINGNVYICLTPHVSGTFSTDLSAARWELFVERGAAGAGTGDLVSTNNLSDVTNAATALANLGGQPLDPLLTDISNLTDPNADRLLFWDDSVGDIGWLTPSTGLSVSGTNIAVSGLTTSQISAATLVTESEGISSNDNDTTIPTSAAVKDYVDTAVSSVGSDAHTLLATVNTTSGTSQSATGLNLTGYKFLLCVVNGVSFNASDNLRIAGQQTSPASGGTGGVLYGHITVDLTSGLFWSTVSVVGPVTNSYVGLTGYSTATTTVTFAPSGAQFDAGSIRVYGAT